MTGVCGGGVQKTASANPANISETRTTRGAARLKPVGNDPSSAGMALGSQIKPRMREIIVSVSYTHLTLPTTPYV